MRSIWDISAVFPFIVIFLSAVAMAGASGGRKDEERQTLLERQRFLEDRIDTLKREQDFLLFQKAVYLQDSKYLVVDVKYKTAQLKYKNKILKDIRIFSASSGRNLKRGAVLLTKKVSARTGRGMLIFGKSLVIEARGNAGARIKRSGETRISVGKQDLVSMLNALEAGGMAYIIF